jgi:hypothetical protein
MVGIAQPLCLLAFGTEGRRSDGTMNTEKENSQSLVTLLGLDSKHPMFAVAGEVFVLTSLNYLKVAKFSQAKVA